MLKLKLSATIDIQVIKFQIPKTGAYLPPYLTKKTDVHGNEFTWKRVYMETSLNGIEFTWKRVTWKRVYMETSLNGIEFTWKRVYTKQV